MTWPEWSRWFIELYGLGDRYAATVAAWVKDVFIPGGTTPEEMREAALSVARSGPPAWPNEILKALLEELRVARAERIMAEEEQERLGGGEVGPPGCRLCGGTGWVTVPHHPQPERAQARGYLATCAVRCRCHCGGRFSAAAMAAMSLDQYERDNPLWREQMAMERRRLLAEARAEDGTGRMAGLIESLIKNASRRR
jgi:hypothetical protein